jgi:AcrR family transcriptional regulator
MLNGSRGGDVDDDVADPERPGGDVPPARLRLSADDRRRQLIGIGLRLLLTTPIHQLSIDDVAEDAGISRSLLFHYFPTKRDYYAAVVRAACRRILRAVDAGGAPDVTPVHGMIDGFLGYIERRREPYVAFVRGAAGGDAWIQEIYEDMRGQLVERAMTALRATGWVPPSDDALTHLAVRGWLAFAEEVILEWTLDPRLPREQLVTLLADALDRLVAITPRPTA